MCDTKYWKSIRAFNAYGELGGFVICLQRSDGMLVQKTLFPDSVGFSRWEITDTINKLESFRNCLCTLETKCEKHKEQS